MKMSTLTGSSPVLSTPSPRGLTPVTRVFLRVIVPAIILLVWWWLSVQETSELFVANPVAAVSRVFTDFFSTDPSKFFLGEATYLHVFPSLARVLQGIALAIVAGVSAGILLGRIPLLAALLGVFFILFGTGDSPKVFLIAFGIVWPILFNTIDGVSSVGETRMQAAQVFRIPQLQVLFHIILPGAAPKIFAGVRTALSMALIIMIISELQKSANGLGYYLVNTQRNFDYTGFWAVLVVLAVLGMAFNLIFSLIERRVLAWHRGVTAQHD